MPADHTFPTDRTKLTRLLFPAGVPILWSPTLVFYDEAGRIAGGGDPLCCATWRGSSRRCAPPDDRCHACADRQGPELPLPTRWHRFDRRCLRGESCPRAHDRGTDHRHAALARRHRCGACTSVWAWTAHRSLPVAAGDWEHDDTGTGR